MCHAHSHYSKWYDGWRLSLSLYAPPRNTDEIELLRSHSLRSHSTTDIRMHKLYFGYPLRVFRIIIIVHCYELMIASHRNAITIRRKQKRNISDAYYPPPYLKANLILIIFQMVWYFMSLIKWMNVIKSGNKLNWMAFDPIYIDFRTISIIKYCWPSPMVLQLVTFMNNKSIDHNSSPTKTKSVTLYIDLLVLRYWKHSLPSSPSLSPSPPASRHR